MYVATAHFPPGRGYAGFCAEASVRRQRHDGSSADRRSADLTRRQMGDLNGPERRRDGQYETFANLDRGRSGGNGRWAAAPDHSRWPIQPAAALVSGFQADRLPFRPRRLVANLAHGPRWRQRQTNHQSFHRGRWRTVRPRRDEPDLHQRSLSRMRRRRRLQQEEPRRRKGQQSSRSHLHRIAVPALDRVADRPPQPSAGGPRGGRSGPRPHARKEHRPAILARRPRRLRHFARRPGSLLLHERRRGAGHQHQRRPLRGLH